MEESNTEDENTKQNVQIHKLALHYAEKALEEAYKWDNSISKGVSLQIAILSILITAIIALEIGLYENHFKLFALSFVLSFFIILTILIAILLAIASQWRMKRASFFKTGEIIDIINKSNSDKQIENGYNEIIGVLQSVEESMNNNNRIRTKILHAAIILAIASICEIIISSVLIICVTISI